MFWEKEVICISGISYFYDLLKLRLLDAVIQTFKQDSKCMCVVTFRRIWIFAPWTLFRWSYHLNHRGESLIMLFTNVCIQKGHSKIDDNIVPELKEFMC